MFLELKKNEQNQIIGYEIIAENEADIFVLDKIKKMYRKSQVSFQRSESFDFDNATFKLGFVNESEVIKLNAKKWFKKLPLKTRRLYISYHLGLNRLPETVTNEEIQKIYEFEYYRNKQHHSNMDYF